MDCSGVRVFTVDFLWSGCCRLPPAHPLNTLAQNWCAPPKNDLKWPKIKQVTNSKLCYIKFNISIGTILLNKAGLTRAKAGYTNYNFKTGISTIIPRCELGRFSRGRSHMCHGISFMYHGNEFTRMRWAGKLKNTGVALIPCINMWCGMPMHRANIFLDKVST